MFLHMPRPFSVPFFPVTPFITLLIAVVALVAMTYYNGMRVLIFLGVLILTYLLFKVFEKQAIQSNEI